MTQTLKRLDFNYKTVAWVFRDVEEFKFCRSFSVVGSFGSLWSFAESRKIHGTEEDLAC